jgi:hypothetical protein
VEHIVARGRLEKESEDFATRYGGDGYVLFDETTGEVLYTLADPKGILEVRAGDIVQIHGTAASTRGEIPLLEVTRVD